MHTSDAGRSNWRGTGDSAGRSVATKVVHKPVESRKITRLRDFSHRLYRRESLSGGSLMSALWKSLASLALIEAVAFFGTRPAVAGCGCDKPPPPPAQVRPNAAYAGVPISVFSP